VAARFNFDPSAIAGPFETSMQDMIGFMVLMFMARAMNDSSFRLAARPASCILVETRRLP
jgi:hypothetical protein